MIWLNLNILKNTQYEIKFILRAFPDFLICSITIMTYNYFNILESRK